MFKIFGISNKIRFYKILIRFYGISDFQCRTTITKEKVILIQTQVMQSLHQLNGNLLGKERAGCNHSTSKI